jgi:L-ascorbate metabolism protein UlaG (beta-lactamase superfamily)
MRLQLLRHATLVIEYGGLRWLVDPMLSDVDAMEPVGNAITKQRIPMRPLPMTMLALAELLGSIHAVLVTHTHRDHWDKAAIALLRKDLPIFCQPPDASLLTGQGFTQVQSVESAYTWQGITLQRTGGQHGTGEIGAQMGAVSGFIFTATNEPRLYVAGDTIWCDEVAQALSLQPNVAVVNAGAAQFLTGDPITMTPEDVRLVALSRPDLCVVAVHMDTINHCLLSRDILRGYVHEQGLSERVLIPDDGAWVNFGSCQSGLRPV